MRPSAGNCWRTISKGLLAALKRMRKAGAGSPTAARQMREGADLVVKLADRLQEPA